MYNVIVHFFTIIKPILFGILYWLLAISLISVPAGTAMELYKRSDSDRELVEANIASAIVLAVIAVIIFYLLFFKYHAY